MWFLVKVTFWLVVVVMLIPTGNDSTQRASKVGPADAVSAAQATVDDMRGFCARQPDVCEIGGQFLVTFTEKAQVGARMLYEFLQAHGTERNTPTTTGSLVEPPVETGAATLAPGERDVPWRGPDAHPPVPARRRG